VGLILGGVRVADLSIVTAGAGGTQVLADFGADVIKIEGPDRPDLFRHWTAVTGKAGGEGDLGNPPFRVVNRNKRGISVNLKDPRGTDLVLRLVSRSDLVVENFRRGVLDRLGLGFDRLVEARNDIVLLSVGSQGSTGPEAAYTSFGSTLDALGGLMSVTGYDERNPLWSSNKVNWPDQVVSLLTPALAISGILAARDTGQPRWIDLSQREVVTSLLGELLLMRSLSGVDPVPMGNGDPSGVSLEWCSPCRGDDDWVAISLADPAQLRACCELIGAAGRYEWPDFQAGAREANFASLRDAVAGWTAGRDKADAMASLQRAGVPATAVMRGAEMLSDPYLRGIGFYQQVALPSGGTEWQRGWPVRFAEGPAASIRRPAPHVGQDSAEVLTGVLGLTNAQIDELIQDGVVGAPY
jgi:crotonobetainyl-CoA:carnitine CoA-transferase CaiB-like acyl-CoA transferase